MEDFKKKESGLIKEIIVIIGTILILSYFGINTQEAAIFIKSSFNWIIDIFN